MPSEARRAFEENLRDVERLMEIHSDLAGGGPGRRHGVEVLNKSAVVLMCAVWEAYCEDLAGEALEHLVAHAESSDGLPKELRKQIAAELEDDLNELAAWRFAGDGWRDYAKARLAELSEERNRTPTRRRRRKSTSCS